MTRIFALLVALLWFMPANAQQANTVASCGSVTFDLGAPHALMMDAKGRLCIDEPPYPSGATPVTGSATGTTGVVTATLPAVAAKTTYICGFLYQGTNATAATNTSVTITGVINGTMIFGYPTIALGVTIPNPGPLLMSFRQCVPGSAVNTAVAVNGPALGAGATLATVAAWGYQL